VHLQHWCDTSEAIGALHSSTSARASPNPHSAAHDIMCSFHWAQPKRAKETAAILASTDGFIMGLRESSSFDHVS
jgi:hypothetical protein